MQNSSLTPQSICKFEVGKEVLENLWDKDLKTVAEQTRVSHASMLAGNIEVATF